jgi:hypothetical protein
MRAGPRRVVRKGTEWFVWFHTPRRHLREPHGPAILARITRLCSIPLERFHTTPRLVVRNGVKWFMWFGPEPHDPGQHDWKLVWSGAESCGSTLTRLLAESWGRALPRPRGNGVLKVHEDNIPHAVGPHCASLRCECGPYSVAAALCCVALYCVALYCVALCCVDLL